MVERGPRTGDALREPMASQVLRVAILERLTMLATPETANEILRTALLSCQQLFVPNVGSALETFVNGPLRKFTHTQLGEDAAEALMDDLGIMVRAACAADAAKDDDSHVRMTVRPVEPTRPVSRPAEGLLALDDHFEPATNRPSLGDSSSPRESRVRTSPAIRVIFATRSVPRSVDLAEALGDEAEVQRVSDVFELVDLASAPSDGAVVVVIDREATSVRTSTLAAAEGELPPYAQVVLWGDGTGSNDELPDLIPAPGAWTKLERNTSSAEVATVVREVARASLVPGR